jgi:DNA-binding beta-propeller fold protein YncE
MEMTRQFVADFPGVTPDQIWWHFSSSDPAYGSIDSNGLFTAGVNPGTYLVIATPPDASGLAPDTSVVEIRSLRTTTSLGAGAYALDVRADGTIAGVDGNDQLWFHNGSGTQSHYFPGWPVSVAFSLSGNEVYVAMLTGRLIRIDVATATAIDTTLFSEGLAHVAVRPTDGKIYVTDAAGWLFRVDPTTMAKIDSTKLASASSGLSFGPGGDPLWATTTETGVLYRLGATSFVKVDSVVFGNGLQRLKAMTNGDSVYVADQTNDSVYIIRPSTGARSGVYVCCGPQGVAVSADGKRLYVAQVGGATAVLDRNTMELLGGVLTPGTVRDVIVAPGSGAVYVAADGDAKRIN